MTARRVITGVVLGSLAALTAASCSTGQTAKKDPAETVAYRQRVMKLQGALWKDIQDKQKAGNIEGIAVDAEALALSAERIPALFPEGSMTDKSKAKPEVWQKWPEFEAAAKNLEAQSMKLKAAADTKNADATGAIIKDFGRNACGTCHTPFRVPPPKQG